MGRTYKRDPDRDDFDDPTFIDLEIDEDEDDAWMTRPNAAPPKRSARRPRAALPDDWRDFDLGGGYDDGPWSHHH